MGVAFIEAVPGGDDSRAALKHRRDALKSRLMRFDWVLAMGNEGLLISTGHSGIMKWRSKPIDNNTLATLHPAMVNMKPGYYEGWISDIRFFVAMVQGKPSRVKMPPLLIVNNERKLARLMKELDRAELLSYDVETTATPTEFHQGAALVSLAGTYIVDGEVRVFALPLFHPESEWLYDWQEILLTLGPSLLKPKKQLAHNSKYDARWLRQFGVPARCTFDTILAAHLLDENRPKGLKRQATSRLGVANWEINTKNLLTEPIRKILYYNALDTYYTYEIYLELKQELMENPRLLRIFRLLMMPANEILIEVERGGIWIDREKLASHTKIGFDMRDEIDRKLMEYVPSVEEREDWPKRKRGKREVPAAVNFNASNFARWWLFEYLGLPALEVSEKTGTPSMKEAVMLELRGAHPVVDLLLERSKWQKYCSAFLTAYGELVTDEDRIHTSFKLTGTVTGRLSSGKTDEEKITAKVPRKGINLQQVPRDPFIRGLFGAAPGYCFVEADFSQVELRVAAFLSRDRTMLHLYQTGQDIHTATASWVMGKPADQVTKEDRKKAKAVNFGFVYGMGARKFVLTAFEKYELRFSEEEAEEIRKAFFNQFKGLQPWHARQRRVVRQNAQVTSPLGRIRRLPDVASSEQGVRAEAERQAINSPVQSFASDMTLLSMVLIHQRFRREGLKARVIGTIHDALLFEVAVDEATRACPIIKETMENLPLAKKFGVRLDVPILADLSIGKYWGLGHELAGDEVWNLSTEKVLTLLDPS